VRVRIVDLDRGTTIDVNRERDTRVRAMPFSWLYFPTNVPTLEELDRTWPPLTERPEVRNARTDASMGCRTDPRGAVLVCHATRRVDHRVIYVQRGFVRGAVRAIYERNRELFRLVVVLLPVSLVLGYWLSRRMLRPLEALRNEALLRARAMDPGAPLSIELGDEIGDVKQALNALLSAVTDQKLATEAFVADLAHEAKNPVASIRACADALASGDLSEERRERIARNLRRSSDRLERVVNELLDLARVEAGMPRESQERVDMSELARALVADAQTDHPEIAFELETSGALPLRGVPLRLEAAVRNLIDNAASFAKSRIDVSVAREDDRIVLGVRDDGPGIDPELLPRVFERFFTTRGGRAGTGLGLAMVRAVAQAHGGFARASSNASGAFFELVLPAA
jgi:two-component system sensor histidine kinase ChvG